MDSQLIAKSLIKQHAVRSELLAPFHELAELCWLILLQIYGAETREKRTAEFLAAAVKIQPPSAERYLKLLESNGYVTTVQNEGGIVAQLSAPTYLVLEELLFQMADVSRTTPS